MVNAAKTPRKASNPRTDTKGRRRATTKFKATSAISPR